jgi:hypothetical protein
MLPALLGNLTPWDVHTLEWDKNLNEFVHEQYKKYESAS